MEKFDLAGCSIVVPFEIDCPEREEHLEFLKRYFTKYFYNHELLLIEKKTEGLFSPAEVSNLGASRVKTPFFCKWDVDAFVHPQAVFKAFEGLKRGACFLLPYDGYSWDIQNPLRQEIIQSIDWGKLLKHECLRLKNDQSTGLIHFFKTSVFRDLGGYNEEFVGWGYEDEEIVVRFEKLGHPKEMIGEYPAYHLHHPRKKGDSIQAFKNYYRYLAVKNMPPEEILDYIQNWKSSLFPR